MTTAALDIDYNMYPGFTLKEPYMDLMERFTERWYPLEWHPEQYRLWTSPARFRVVPAGRRSGKTEYAKRFLVMNALNFTKFHNGWFIAAAPTHKQAKQIWWGDLCEMVPEWALWADKKSSISKSNLTIKLFNGAVLQVVGLDAPDRIEGSPVDGIIVDEYGNCKPDVWNENVRPALSTKNRYGWAWLIGVPEGRNHYYKMSERAKQIKRKQWDVFHWKSAEILDPEEIEQAKEDLSPRLFRQEYEASFETFGGRAYPDFDDNNVFPVEYDSNLPLYFCFDFNRNPGVAAVIQEQTKYNYRPLQAKKDIADTFTAVIDEVWIPQGSYTRLVAEKLAEDWKYHRGAIYLDGDATGGREQSSSNDGSDWDIINDILGDTFPNQVMSRVPRGNPPETSRVNSVNNRIMNAKKIRRVLVNRACEHIIDDFQGVTTIDGTNGRIDKKKAGAEHLTHISDAIGYHIHRMHPYGSADSIAGYQM